MDYNYMYLGQNYLTVSNGLYGWIGRIRDFREERPVTFCLLSPMKQLQIYWQSR